MARVQEGDRFPSEVAAAEDSDLILKLLRKRIHRDIGATSDRYQARKRRRDQAATSARFFNRRLVAFLVGCDAHSALAGNPALPRG